jgi:hypothetical protein
MAVFPGGWGKIPLGVILWAMIGQEGKSMPGQSRLIAGETPGDVLFVVHFFWEMQCAILVTQTDGASQEYGHRLVGCKTRIAVTLVMSRGGGGGCRSPAPQRMKRRGKRGMMDVTGLTVKQ